MDVEGKVETLCKPQPQDRWAEQIEEWSKPPGDSNEIPTKSHWQSLKQLLELMYVFPVYFKVLYLIGYD